MILCIFCSTDFTTKGNLKRHLVNKKCTYKNLEDGEKAFQIQEKIMNLSLSNTKTVNANTIVNGNVNGNINNININITVNPVTKLNVSYLEPSKMKELVEKFDYPSFNYLITNYIKDILHNKDHPENHSVKYIKVRPPTFSNTVNHEGKSVNVIKNLKDSCELLSEPVLLNLKRKLKECNKFYKNDQDFQDLYEDTVRDIFRELNKESVKKALSTVLQTDILNDIEMKVI